LSPCGETMQPLAMALLALLLVSSDCFMSAAAPPSPAPAVGCSECVDGFKANGGCALLPELIVFEEEPPYSLFPAGCEPLLESQDHECEFMLVDACMANAQLDPDFCILFDFEEALNGNMRRKLEHERDFETYFEDKVMQLVKDNDTDDPCGMITSFVGGDCMDVAEAGVCEEDFPGLEDFDIKVKNFCPQTCS